MKRKEPVANRVYAALREHVVQVQGPWGRSRLDVALDAAGSLRDLAQALLDLEASGRVRLDLRPVGGVCMGHVWLGN